MIDAAELEPLTPPELEATIQGGIRMQRQRDELMDWNFFHFWLPVGVTLEQQLGFLSRSVTIDNMTSRYMYVHNVGRFIPPYTHGVTMMLTGTQKAVIDWIAPPGILEPALVVGQSAYALFRSDRPAVVGTGSISATPPWGVADDRLVVPAAGTPVNFPALPCRLVAITALSTNTQIVAVGAATVVAAAATRRGAPLAPGQAITVTIDELSKLWLDAMVNGEGVSYMVLV